MISTTSQLIALVESNNDSSALRYEPLWRYVTPELIAICKRSHTAYMNDATARAAMMFSYGKYQEMGSVLYEHGYRGKLSNFQTNTTLQDAWFETYLAKKDIVYTLNELAAQPKLRERFALRYNGSPVAYVPKMIKVMRDNNIAVVE